MAAVLSYGGAPCCGLPRVMERSRNAHRSVEGELVANEEGPESCSSIEMPKTKHLRVCTGNPTTHGNVQSTTTCHAPHHDQAHNNYTARRQQQQQQQCDRQPTYSAADDPSASNTTTSNSSAPRVRMSYYSVVSPWKQAASPAVYCATSTSKRRNRVYDNIMGQWKQAASSYVPSPRSSHQRVLGGQALPTRQV